MEKKNKNIRLHYLEVLNGAFKGIGEVSFGCLRLRDIQYLSDKYIQKINLIMCSFCDDIEDVDTRAMPLCDKDKNDIINIGMQKYKSSMKNIYDEFMSEIKTMPMRKKK